MESMSAKTPPALARALTRPVFLRALIAGLFAIPTIFIYGLGQDYLRYGAAALFVLTASQIWDHVKATRAHDSDSEAIHPGQLITAVALMLGGVGMIFATTPFVAALIAGSTLTVAGAAELFAWYKGRKVFLPARDLLISGLVQAGTGLALVIANHLNPHALLGVLAGGMLIISVFWLIAAIGYRFDSKASSLGGVH